MTDLKQAIETARRARRRVAPGLEAHELQQPAMASGRAGSPTRRAPGLPARRRRDTAAIVRRVGRAALAPVAAALALAALMTIAPPFGSCRNDPARIVFGETFEVAMRVRTDRACALSLRLGGAAVDALEVTRAPAHGALVPRGRTGVIYRPGRAFAGEDFFSFTLHGQSALYKGASTVRVRVAVD
ncbi:MAG: hypothetical protein M5U07_28005 [Xanthobacteraceae bacterium]|nr:hypothetical protein [Xanthobacteraceae bacterium]